MPNYGDPTKKKRVMPTNVQKSKVAAGKPVVSKSAYSTAAQKRMKADAQGTYKPAASVGTRVLPEMSGKLVKKAQSVAKKPSMKRGK
jgi:hypothetical protein